MGPLASFTAHQKTHMNQSKTPANSHTTHILVFVWGGGWTIMSRGRNLSCSSGSVWQTRAPPECRNASACRRVAPRGAHTRLHADARINLKPELLKPLLRLVDYCGTSCQEADRTCHRAERKLFAWAVRVIAKRSVPFRASPWHTSGPQADTCTRG